MRLLVVYLLGTAILNGFCNDEFDHFVETLENPTDAEKAIIIGTETAVGLISGLAGSLILNDELIHEIDIAKFEQVRAFEVGDETSKLNTDLKTNLELEVNRIGRKEITELSYEAKKIMVKKVFPQSDLSNDPSLSDTIQTGIPRRFQPGPGEVLTRGKGKKWYVVSFPNKKKTFSDVLDEIVYLRNNGIKINHLYVKAKPTWTSRKSPYVFFLVSAISGGHAIKQVYDELTDGDKFLP